MSIFWKMVNLDRWELCYVEAQNTELKTDIDKDTEYSMMK